MLKKLNNKLLSQYPLLWNTKLIYVLPAALLIHLLFYIAGFLTKVEISELNNFRYFKEFETVIFSVLVSIVIIILWLVYYLRNNPLKSFYTINRNYLFKEFLLISLVFFTSATFFITFQQGKYDKIKLVTSDVDLVEEANIINLSNHFIAYNWEDFNIQNSCKYVKQRETIDSIRKAEENSSNGQLSSYKAKPIDYDYEERSYKNDNELYSYLFYCGQEVKFDSEEGKILNKYQLHAKAENWLKENHTDSVLNLLNKLVTLCKKYTIKYSFNPDNQVAECFRDSAFTVNRVFDNSYSSYGRTDPPFVNLRGLKSSLNRIDEVRVGFWSVEIFLVWLLSAFAAAIMLFTFRVTRLKHWFIGLIGVGLWSIIIVLTVFIFRLENGIIPLVLFIWLALFALGLKQILSKTTKLLAGIIYNWIFWFTPFVIPLIIAQIDSIARKDCYYLGGSFRTRVNSSACNTHHWIDNHWTEILFIDIAVVLLVIYLVFIPLARKWQSNPEE